MLFGSWGLAARCWIVLFQAALLYHKGSPKDGFRIYISFCTDGLAGYLLHL